MLPALRVVICICLAGCSSAALADGKRHDVRAAGAKGDGTTNDQAAIQRVIDAAAGDTVALPEGKYLARWLMLPSRVTLELAAGATLVSNLDIHDAQQVAIVGRDRKTSRILGYISLKDSHGLRFENFHQEGISGQGFVTCSNVKLDGVTIHQPPRRHGGGSAIWFAYCKDVHCSECEFMSNDDVYCLKRSCENIHLTKSVLIGRMAAPFKIGTETDGDFKNITMTDCTIRDSDRAAISIESVDGSIIDGVYISDIKMQNVATPLFIRLGHRARYGSEKPGSIRNITINNVAATGGEMDDGIGSSIVGLPGHPVESVQISNLKMVHRGGGTAADAKRRPKPMVNGYPEYDMFGKLPAYGLFVRDAKGLTMRDVTFETVTPDARPAMVFESVDGLSLDRIRAAASDTAGSVLRFDRVSRATLRPTNLPTNVPLLQIDNSVPVAPPQDATSYGDKPVWIDRNGDGKQDADEPSFATLGGALAAASRGDAIRLQAGVYGIAAESLPLVVDTPGVSIAPAKGEGTVTIATRGTRDDSGRRHSVFYVAAADVKLESLSIQGGVYSVFVDGVANTSIKNCSFDNAKRYHIALANSTGAKVIGNRSQLSGYGFLAMHGGGKSLIADNRIEDDPAGLRLIKTSENTVRGNSIRGTLWYGMHLEHCGADLIEKNAFKGNRLVGIDLSACEGVRVIENEIVGCKTEAILLTRGSKGNVFERNTFVENRRGDIVEDYPQPSESPKADTAAPPARRRKDPAGGVDLTTPVPRRKA